MIGDFVRAVPRRAHAVARAASRTLADRKSHGGPPVEPPTDPHPMRLENLYEVLYEQHATVFDDERAIGRGDYDQFGRVELAILKEAGLRPDSTLLDMGCGTGRLGVHAVPYLSSGRYIGTDISDTMLTRARHHLAPLVGAEVELVKQPPSTFPAPDASVDMICAFSVFTHMEPEDMYRYLVDARRIVAPDGCFVMSCLPIEIELAREVFLESAALTFEQRWRGVRNFITSVSTVAAISSWAGWNVRTWHDAVTARFATGVGEERRPLGQSTAVLEPA